MKLLIKPLALILTNCLLLAQAEIDPSTIKVAYAGIKVDNVEPWVEAELQKKLSSIFDGLKTRKGIEKTECSRDLPICNLSYNSGLF